MEYREQIATISEAILNLKGDRKIDLSSILHKDFEMPIKIYQNNYLSGAIKAMQDDYPGTEKYLGKNNFEFFIRKMLIDQGIRSPNIIDWIKEFPLYLRSQYDIHQDELLAGIAQIDWLCNYGGGETLSVPKGLLLFWQELLGSRKTEAKIDLSETEKIQVRYIDGERYLTPAKF